MGADVGEKLQIYQVKVGTLSSAFVTTGAVGAAAPINFWQQMHAPLNFWLLVHTPIDFQTIWTWGYFAPIYFQTILKWRYEYILNGH